MEKAKETTTENNNYEEKGERAAVRYLEKKGYSIIAQNWKCETGSVDIVACEDDTLVFVDVDITCNEKEGFPEKGAGKKKLQEKEMIASAFLLDYDKVDLTVRFDEIAILVLASDRAFLRHHINAYNC